MIDAMATCRAGLEKGEYPSQIGTTRNCVIEEPAHRGGVTVADRCLSVTLSFSEVVRFVPGDEAALMNQEV